MPHCSSKNIVYSSTEPFTIHQILDVGERVEWVMNYSEQIKALSLCLERVTSSTVSLSPSGCSVLKPPFRTVHWSTACVHVWKGHVFNKKSQNEDTEDTKRWQWDKAKIKNSDGIKSISQTVCFNALFMMAYFSFCHFYKCKATAVNVFLLHCCQ